ncbi:MAG: U32 family peptidase [Thermoguttaceae bacterium]|nr:U32 family peptidase [Thermoguttaceae bacterium]
MTIKILGPAGGREAFDAAILAGADEIYMGLAGYGARLYAENFTTDQFIKALYDAHQLGVKLSLTLNTLMSEREVEAVFPDLDRLVSAGLDSVIIQDWGVLRFLKRRYPHLGLHGSTQMGLGNAREVQFASECGLTRVVLPRELSIDEIASIRSASPDIELEIFCSGALCLGCSGKCYLSSYVGGRSGNRGSCAQPCRQSYVLQSDNGADSSTEGYFLSLRDQLFSQKDIEDISKIGIDVVKIEGRMKSPSYVFEAVRRYRTLIDSLGTIDKGTSQGDLQPIERLFNRGYGPGYLHEHDPEILNPRYSSHYGIPAGEIKNGRIYLTAPLVNGDGVVYLDKNFKKLRGTNVNTILLQPKLYGDHAKKVSRADVGSVVTLGAPVPSSASYLYKTLDFSQLKETAHLFKTTKRRRPITLALKAKIGYPLRLTLTLVDSSYPTESVTLESDQLLEKSHNQRLDESTLTSAIDRFGTSPFGLQSLELDYDPDVFLPKSLLNKLRQDAVNQLKSLSAVHRRNSSTINTMANIVSSEFVDHGCATKIAKPLPLSYAAAVRTWAQGNAVLSSGITTMYRVPSPIRYEDEAIESGMEKELIDFEKDLNPHFSFQPIAGNITEALFYEERGILFTADTSFNVTNYESGLFLLEQFPHLSTLYLSNELSRNTLLRLGERLIPLLGDRGGRVGLSVYGHPIAMYTRKTIFDSKKVVLESQGRKFLLFRNKELFPEKKITTPISGTSVFYYPPLNILEETGDFPSGWELRFDFTIETPSEISEVTDSWKSNKRIRGVGYGFEHPIF